MAKGTSQSVMSGTDGSFILKNVADDAVIVIRYVGYLTREVKAVKNLGNIAMEMSYNDLD